MRTILPTCVSLGILLPLFAVYWLVQEPGTIARRLPPGVAVAGTVLGAGLLLAGGLMARALATPPPSATDPRR